MQHDKLHTTDDDKDDVLRDGEWYLINPMMKDHRPGAAMTFRDASPANLADARQRMEDARTRAARDLNAWRNEGATTTHGPVTDASLADAYSRSVQDLNAWRGK